MTQIARRFLKCPVLIRPDPIETKNKGRPEESGKFRINVSLGNLLHNLQQLSLEWEMQHVCCVYEFYTSKKRTV